MVELHRSSPAELKERLEAERRGSPFLLYRDGDGRQRIVGLTPQRPRISVGRHPASDVPLPWDTEVSRVHVDIECISGVWTIVDDGRSRNGSLINGERLRGRRALHHADMIRVGRTSVTFIAPSQPEFQSTAPAVGELGPPVSVAQRRVLVALCRPLASGPLAAPASNAQLAEELSLSVDTIKSHLHALFEAFGLDHVTQYQTLGASARGDRAWRCVERELM